MAKPRNKFLDYCAYLIVRVLGFVLLLLPLKWVQTIGAAMGWTLYSLDKRHRNRVHDNLSTSFPEKSAEEINQITKDSFKHLGMLLVEVLWIPKLVQKDRWKKHLVFDVDELKKRMKGDRPIIVVSGHIGNFEIGGVAVVLQGLKFHSVVRPLDNPYLDRFLIEIRQILKQDIINKKGALKETMKVLRRGDIAMFIADQNAGSDGVFVDFFGRKASTVGSVAALAIKLNAQIAIGYAHRIENGKFFLCCNRFVEIDPQQYRGNLEEGRQIITQAFTSELEAVIRERPEQWFWIHRRWKSRPPKELEGKK